MQERNDELEFIRQRITELRMDMGRSEHGMSLDLDRSGGYIRAISNGLTTPSVQGLMDIIYYLEVSPAEFFAPMGEPDTLYHRLCKRLRAMDTKDQEKVAIFLDLIGK